MEFYSFRFIDMKVAQADTATPKVMAVEIGLGFKAPGQHTVEAIKLTVHVPHDPDKTVSAAEKEAYGIAQELLHAEIEHDAVAAVKLHRVLAHLEHFFRRKELRHIAERLGVGRLRIDGR